MPRKSRFYRSRPISPRQMTSDDTSIGSAEHSREGIVAVIHDRHLCHRQLSVRFVRQVLCIIASRTNMMRQCVVGLIGIAIGAGIGCTSTQTATALAAPSSQKCQVQIANTPSTFTENGGDGSLSVTTNRDCA